MWVKNVGGAETPIRVKVKIPGSPSRNSCATGMRYAIPKAYIKHFLVIRVTTTLIGMRGQVNKV